MLKTRMYQGCDVLGPYLAKDKGRYYVQLFRNGVYVQSMYLARFIYQEYYGRILGYEEHVDHIDENKQNDIIPNLQILSPKENNEKSFGKYPQTVEAVCLECLEPFEMDRVRQRSWAYRKRHGAVGPFCGNSCSKKFTKREGV